jgi:aspartyl-tRNA(Asn)/glutamyl-tRNA(Gln) amidotransferase subunit A
MSKTDRPSLASAAEIAGSVTSGRVTAQAVIDSALDTIAEKNGDLNAFTTVTADRARTRADALDRAIASGKRPGPLAGVPFAVKNLFDIEGVPTIAGSKINRSRAAAKTDSPLISRLEAAGAILVGALSMGEYAYDFTGENAHDGPSRNPHDTRHMTGGSSGGSGAAVAGGLVPISLGSDTNGSIRVPASFCGLFGLKPTYGRLPRNGTFPFVASLDHLGPLARTVTDLALAYDVLQGADPNDPVCTDRTPEFASAGLDDGIDNLRFAVAGGYFQVGCHDEAKAAVERVASALGATKYLEIPEVARARAAAFVITAAESAALHLDRIRAQPQDFDPDVRDRLIAGAMIPAASVQRAQKFRRWYRDKVLELFRTVDVIVAPATPCTAPLIGQKVLRLGEVEVPLRPNIGIYTQPLSFIGLPVVAVPLPLKPLPVAVQIVAAPWREDIALRVARHLESMGVCMSSIPGATQA